MSRILRKPPFPAAEGENDDNPLWTENEWARATYFPNGIKLSDVTDEILEEVRKKSRGVQKAATKVPVSLRLSRDVLDHFKGTGPGWQTRIDEALRKVAKLKKVG